MRRLVFLPIALLAAGGCRPPQPPGGRFSQPPPGVVRLLAAPGNSSQGVARYHWSLIGERNWRKAALSGADIQLSEVYPLNDPKNQGGCHTWEFDLSVEKGRYRLIAHGSNGETAFGEGDASGDVRLYAESDSQFRLPAVVTLASIGGQKIRLSVPER